MKLNLPDTLFRRKSSGRKEKLLLGLFLIFGCGSAYSQVHLDIEYNDGSETEIYRASQIETICFGEDNMLTIFPYFLDCYYTINPGKVARINFSDAPLPEVGIRKVGSQNMTLYPNPALTQFAVSGVSGTSLQVFSADGALRINLPQYEGQQIDITSLPSGVYIVKAGNFTSKLIKK